MEFRILGTLRPSGPRCRTGRFRRRRSAADTAAIDTGHGGYQIRAGSDCVDA
jgi:hypothetical protein